MKSLFLFFATAIFLFFSITSQAAEETAQNNDKPSVEQNKGGDSLLSQVGHMATEAKDKVSKTLSESKERRKKADYFALFIYSPFDLLIPSKYGFTLGSIKNADKTWEFEFLRGSISVPFIIEDLGKMTDMRYSIIKRSYLGGNSFNLSYGLSYFDFSLHLGNSLMSRLTNGSYPSIDLIGVQAIGFNLAFGNRWTFKHNFTIGIDWISCSQPAYITNKKSSYLDYVANQKDKDDVEKAINVISYFPRLAFFKFQIGFLF